MDRILVKAISQQNNIQLKIISREHGCPFYFSLSKDVIMELEHDDTLTPRDIGSAGQPKACFFRLAYARELLICFSWFTPPRTMSLWLPYDDFMEFVQETDWENAPTEWKCLSLKAPKPPRIVFHGKNLHNCLTNQIVRKKLLRFLRDDFTTDPVREIHFYDRVIPYSFTFREICDTPDRRVGALTLFGQQDLSNAFYRVHSHFEVNPYPNLAAL